MREILFRGKRTDNKQWVEGFYALIGEENPNAYIIKNNGHRVRVAHKSVSEYTGLTDKNGKKIFEGDIVNVNTKPNSLEHGYIGKHLVVRFDEYHRFVASGRLEYPASGRLEYPLCNHYEWKVIGNIHDNPEPLKGGEG